MKYQLAATAATAALLGAGAAAAQASPYIDPICLGVATEAGYATTHNVVYDDERGACIAWLVGTPTPASLAGVPAAAAISGPVAAVGALGTGTAVAAGLVTLGVLAAVADSDSDGPIITPITTP